MKPESWNCAWAIEVEQAIARLESAVVGNTHDILALNPLSDRPATTPHEHVIVALSHMSNLNFRMAIREYEKVLAASPELADSHWGIAVSLYSLVVLDMLVRRLCTVSKSEARLAARPMSEETYLQREAKLLAQGALMFTSAGRAMRDQGWQERELVGVIALALGQAPGLIPDTRRGIDMSRQSLPTDLIPLATFSPDDAARVLLDLSNQRFLAGNMYGQIRVPPNILNFFDYEMRSVHGRVQELLQVSTPRVSAEVDNLKRLRARFDAMRGESDTAFELFAGFRTAALRERNPDACVHAGAMFLAGAFYTVAEELFLKALELLPTSTGALWGLAQTYYGLALFDLFDRGRFDIGRYQVEPQLVTRIRGAPLKYDIGAMLGLSTVRSFHHVFDAKGLDRSELSGLFSLLQPERDRPLPKVVPLPAWKPDEGTMALWRLALEYAERARNGSALAQTHKPLPFDSADLEAFHADLVAVSGGTVTHKATSATTPHTMADPLGEARELYHQRQFEKAAELLDRRLRDGVEDAETWNWLANCQMELQEYESAIHSFDQSIRLSPNEARNWNDKGIALRRLCRFNEAVACFQTAQSLDPANTIPSQNIDDLRRYERSLEETARKIVESFEELSPPQRASFHRASFAYKRAIQLKELGQDLQATRQLDNAIRVYRELPYCQSLEWSALVIFCDAAQATDGVPPSAIIAARTRIRELIPILRSENPAFQSEDVERNAAFQLGAALLAGGRWEDVLWICNELGDKCRNAALFQDELRFLTLKSAALQSIGALPEAEQAQLRMLEICKDSAVSLDPKESVFHELTYAQTLLQMRRFEEVCDRTAHARHDAATLGLSELVFLADVLTASGLFGLRRYQEAYECFSKILADAQAGRIEAPNVEGHLGRLLHHTGKSLLKLGRIDEALEKHRAALRRERIWWAHEGLSCALEARRQPGQLAEALSSRMRAIEQAERESKSLSVSEFQSSWFEDKADIYANVACQLLQMTFDEIPLGEHNLRQWGSSVEELALHLIDRGKARTLLQLMYALSAKGGQSELLEERRALADEISTLIKVRGVAPRPGGRHQFERETEQIEARIARQREIEALLRKNGRAPLIDPDLLKPLEFQKTLRAGEACIEYSATENRLLILVLTPQSIQAHQVDIERDAPTSASLKGKLDTGKLAALYRQQIQSPEVLGLEGLIQLQRDWMDNWQASALSEQEHVAVSVALAQVLLPTEVRRSLSAQSVRHLLIVPSHWLAVVPFSTLVLETAPDDSLPRFRDCRFVMQEYSVSFVQSLSVLNAIRQRERNPPGGDGYQMLAFADPVHYDSDPRASSQGIKGRSPANGDPLHAEAVRLSLLRSFNVIAADSSREIWPRLQETRMEVLSVAKTFKNHIVTESAISQLPSTDVEAVLCLGHAANRDLALSQATARSRNLLFSVHGHANIVNPWLSYLVLTDGHAKSGSRQPAPLTMADVFNMTLNAETVVLAACETALGRVRMGEGVVGFPLAFLFAGARSVVLTQWQIPSGFEASSGAPEVYPSTAVVTGFYTNWRKGRMSLAEALRQAQLQLFSEHDTFRDPFFWGAWQLYGEWLPEEETIAKGVPGDHGARSKFADALEKQGSLSVTEGRFAEALESFERALRLRDGILSQDPQAVGMVRPWAAVSARVGSLKAASEFDGSMGEELALIERLASTAPRQLLDQRQLGCLLFLAGASAYWNRELGVAWFFLSAAFYYLDLVDRAFPDVPEVLLELIAVISRLQAICFERQETENARRFLALWSEVAKKLSESLVPAGAQTQGIEELFGQLDDLIRGTERSKTGVVTIQQKVFERLSVASNQILVREYAFLSQMAASALEGEVGDAALRHALDVLQKLYDDDPRELLSVCALMHCLLQAALQNIRTGHYLKAMNCYLRMKMVSVDAKKQGMQLDPGTQKMPDALIAQVPRARRFLCALALTFTGGRAGQM